MSVVRFMYKAAQEYGLSSSPSIKNINEKIVSRLVAKHVFDKSKPWPFITAQHHFLRQPATAEKFLKFYLTHAKARGVDPYMRELASYYSKLPSSPEWEPVRKVFQEYFEWKKPLRVDVIGRPIANTAIINKSVKPTLTIPPRWRLPLMLGGLAVGGLGAGYYFGGE